MGGRCDRARGVSFELKEGADHYCGPYLQAWIGPYAIPALQVVWDSDTVQISIQLTAETRDQLKAAGRVGETFDSIIHRLIDAAKYVDFMEQQYSTLKSEKDWVRLSDLP